MLKKDKLHLILRAKRGSQILKYQNPPGPLPEGNPYMTSDGLATPTGELELPANYRDGVDMRSSFRKFWDKNKGNFKQAGQIAGQVGLDVANGLINQGRANQINSSGVDTAFGVADTVGNVAGKINPVLGTAVKGVTTIFKGIDTLFGSKSKEFGVNQSTVSQVGGSYGGSVATINEAASKAGKKYGLFSGGARRRANALIDKAALQQNTMTEIVEEASDQRSMVNDLTYTQNQMDLNGGYDQRYIRAAKHGIKLQDKIDFVIARRLQSRINVNTKQVEEFKNGGQIEWVPEIILDVESFKEGGQIEWKPEIVWEPEIILEPEIQEFKEGGKTRTLEELIEYAKKQNPRFIQRLSEEPKGLKFVDDNGNESVGNVYLQWDTDDQGNAIIYPRIQEFVGQLKFLSSDDAFKRAIEQNNYLRMSPKEAEIFFSEDPEYGTAYKRGWPKMFINFSNKAIIQEKKGGSLKEELETPEIEETNQKNIIPEGALHKNKHHMEHTEGLTQKGIPVVDNDGEQQAEIELDEIIFTLEVTKKLEELYKDGSDKAAIEAGKLLVKEILFNTDDRTGLIAKCEKGGKLNDVE